MTSDPIPEELAAHRPTSRDGAGARAPRGRRDPTHDVRRHGVGMGGLLAALTGLEGGDRRLSLHEVTARLTSDRTAG